MRTTTWMFINFVMNFVHLLFDHLSGGVDSQQKVFDCANTYYNNSRHLAPNRLQSIKRNDPRLFSGSRDFLLFEKLRYSDAYTYSWHMSPFQPIENLTALAALVSNNKSSRILEIGTNQGLVSLILAANSRDRGEVVTIDIVDHVSEVPLVANLFSRFGITHELMRSIDYLDSWDQKPFDLVFIDGDHSFDGVSLDTQLALSVMPQGGIIVWDDYRKKNIPDISRYLEGPNHKMEIFSIEGTSLAVSFVAPRLADRAV